MTQAIVPKELLTATLGGLSLLVVSGGADGHVLTQQADGTYSPEAPSAASGDVVGPSSATDNAIARFDTTTGKLLQNSLVTITDTGIIEVSGAVRSLGAWVTGVNAAQFGKGTWNGDAFISNDFYFENSVGFYIKTGDFIGITATTPNGATRSVRTRLSEASAGVWQVGTTANNALGSINLLNLTATGGITPGSMANAAAANGTIYYSTDAGKLVYKDSGGTVNNLY